MTHRIQGPAPKVAASSEALATTKSPKPLKTEKHAEGVQYEDPGLAPSKGSEVPKSELPRPAESSVKARTLPLPPVPADLRSTAAGQVVDYSRIARELESAPLTAQRRATLTRLAGELQKDMQDGRAALHGQTAVVIAEGFTGIAKGAGRASTDGDENLALVSFAATVAETGMIGHVAVPDDGNLEHTMTSLRALGLPVERFEPGTNLQPGTTYISSQKNEAAVRDIVEQSPEGRKVLLLGPAFADLDGLLDGKVDVRIMGKAEKKGSELANTSTNTKGDEADPESVKATTSFVLKALDLNPIKLSSDTMDRNYTIALDEMRHGSSLIGDPDQKHWVKNTKQQMTGVGAPHYLLDKRLLKGGARALFGTAGMDDGGLPISQIDMNEEKGTGLVFLPLLKLVLKADLKPEALDEAAEKLGPGYGFLLHDDGDEAKKKLLGLFGQRLKAGDPDYDAACELVERKLSGPQAVHTFAAVALAFQNVYEEKTTDGWSRVRADGEQCHANNFEKAYVEAGRQVAYDAFVGYTLVSDMPKTPREQADIADKLMLLYWGVENRSTKSTL